MELDKFSKTPSPSALPGQPMLLMTQAKPFSRPWKREEARQPPHTLPTSQRPREGGNKVCMYWSTRKRIYSSPKKEKKQQSLYRCNFHKTQNRKLKFCRYAMCSHDCRWMTTQHLAFLARPTREKQNIRQWMFLSSIDILLRKKDATRNLPPVLNLSLLQGLSRWLLLWCRSLAALIFLIEILKFEVSLQIGLRPTHGRQRGHTFWQWQQRFRMKIQGLGVPCVEIKIPLVNRIMLSILSL